MIQDLLWWLLEVVTVVALVSLLVLASQAFAEVGIVSAKEFLDAAMPGMSYGAALRLYYIMGVTEALVASRELSCDPAPTYGEIAAWTDAQIWRAKARFSDGPALPFVIRGFAEHGCRVK
jgi:hypothetical protein